MAKKSRSSQSKAGGSVASSRGGGASQKVNVFERLWSRRKFEVVGRKVKGQQKRLGEARSQAIAKRKQTLLVEYKTAGKANTFLDRRFGEQNESLAEDDKAVLRFQRERLAQLRRKSKFQLAEEEEAGQEETLTHLGAALDDFAEEDIPSAEDDDDAALDAEMVRRLHFGGGQEAREPAGPAAEEERPKSKKEIMEEIIAKSKFYKAQRVLEREADAALLQELDAGFQELQQARLLTQRAPKGGKLGGAPGGSEGVLKRTSGDAGIVVLNKAVEGRAGQSREAPEEDDYARLARELTFEARARAGERSKTAEEIAQEERHRLEDLERKRKRRMAGEADSEGDGGGASSEEEEGGYRARRKRAKAREISGDDLGENFEVEEEELLDGSAGWATELLQGADGSEEEEEEGEGASDEDAEVGLSFEEEEVEGSSEDEKVALVQARLQEAAAIAKEKGTRQENTVTGQERGAPKQRQKGLEAVPYVLSAAQSLAELERWVGGRSVGVLVEVVGRMRACTAVGLAVENRRRLQVFFAVLLGYFVRVAGERPLPMERLDALVPPLLELSQQMPFTAATCSQQRLLRLHRALRKRLQDPETHSAWPGPRALLLLRLLTLLFPPTDFRHPVLTPASLLLAECLQRCPVSTLGDAARGALAATLLRQLVCSAGRFCPEALCFLHALLLTALPEHAEVPSSGSLPGGWAALPQHLRQQVGSRPWLELQRKTKHRAGPLPAVDLVAVLSAEASDPLLESDHLRCGVLHTVLAGLRGFLQAYKNLPSCPEIFRPLLPTLAALQTHLAPALEALRGALAAEVLEAVRGSAGRRVPVALRVEKPVAIKQFNPRFEEEGFVQGRDYDPDRERAERKKLKKRLKEEAKGAARELRKDNYFLAEEKRREKLEAETERRESYRKNLAFVEGQEAAFKSGQLGGGKKRKGGKKR